ncbi:hypothetical protein HS961_13745 [Comamonas piscis]|uniref:Uncharacterized protein n=1 Tax=Comamonas piscis TaxID=1562974 RepID=A0A7G5EII5_9BURK|nr:hypothetical protein [Comamonas piscis]QMV73810.1 hypothetical protein HS961_13745 [Comamonas piscis]WSO32234.1 hypothetical protein VUJ63_13785 [Comamonas piscis]
MEIDRQVAWMLFWSLVGTVISFWVGYEILKSAIKNGINASKLGDRQKLLQPAPPPVAPAGYRWVLVKDDKSGPDIRPER